MKSKIFLSVLFSLLVVSLVFCFMPSSYATTSLNKPNAIHKPNAVSQSIAFLNDVYGINVTNYKVELAADRTDMPATYAGLVREQLTINLKTNTSIIQASVVFINNTYAYSIVSPLQGSIVFYHSLPTDNLAAAKQLMQKYQIHKGNAIITEASNALALVENIASANKTAANLQLTAISKDNQADFTWSRVVNSVSYPTGLTVHINGDSLGIADMSSFFKMSNTDVTVSKEQAIQIATDSAHKITLNTSQSDGTFREVPVISTEKPFSVTLDVKCKEPFVQHPIWDIVFIPETNTGPVGSVQVSVWADTGEIAFCSPLAYNGGGSGEELGGCTTINNSSIQQISNGMTLSNVILLCAGIGVSVVAITFMKKQRLSAKGSKITGVIFLCLLCASCFAGIGQAQALIHKSLTSGTDTAYCPPDWAKWDPCTYENMLRVSTTGSISASAMAQTGWEAVSLDYTYGLPGANQSTASNILNGQIQGNSSYDVMSYFHVGDFFDEDHSFHVDPTNESYLYDTDISGNTGSKNLLTFLWVCTTANAYEGCSPSYYPYSQYNIIGMPYAWTHDLTMNLDGYADASEGDHCFIGFNGSSAWLNATEFGYPSCYADWVDTFYQCLYYGHDSVRNALDLATLYESIGTEYFSSTDLYNGYMGHDMEGNLTWWSLIRVLGNTNIVLPYTPPPPGPYLTVNTIDQYNNWVPSSVYIDGNYVGESGSSFQVSAGPHIVAVDNSVYNENYDLDWSFNYFDAGTGGNPTALTISDDASITAHYLFPW